MAFCSNCGQKLMEGVKFCNNCGTPTGDRQAQKEKIVTPPPIQTAAAEQSTSTKSDEPITNRQTVYDGEIHKCPHCGEVLESFMAKCPSCGFELNSKKVSSTLQKFIDEINECEKVVAESPNAGKTGWASWGKSKRFWWVILNLLFVCIPLVIYLALPLVTLKSTPKLSSEEKRLASLIENFPFPNDRESILSALVFAKDKIDFISKESINRKTAYWMRLWCAKAEQLKQKADMLFPNDTIVKDSYNEILADETRVNKTIKIKAIVGLVILVIAVVFCVVRYGGNIGVTDKKDYNATFEWQTTGLFAELPEPDTNNGKIVMETEKQINIELYNMSAEDFETYVKKCREAGFTKEVTKNDGVFYATDEDGYDLNMFYDAKKDVLSIHISSYDLSNSGDKGASTETSSGDKTSGNQTNITEKDNNTVTGNKTLADGVTANSNKYLQIKEVGYSMAGDYLTCVVILNNPSADTVIEMPAFRVTAYDESGKILGSEERILSVIYPKQDFVDQGTLIEVSKKPHKIDVTVLEPEDYNITDASAMDHPEHKQMVGQNISVDSNKITGELFNPNNYKIDSAMITVVFRDGNGNIVSSESEFVDQIPANGKIPFDISLASDAKTTNNIAVYGYIW